MCDFFLLLTSPSTPDGGHLPAAAFTDIADLFFPIPAPIPIPTPIPIPRATACLACDLAAIWHVTPAAAVDDDVDKNDDDDDDDDVENPACLFPAASVGAAPLIPVTLIDIVLATAPAIIYLVSRKVCVSVSFCLPLPLSL